MLGRILPVIDALKGVAIITADHGNADEMYELDKKTGQPSVDKTGRIKAKTSHTLNPVPCVFYDNHYRQAYELAKVDQPGLSNLAATVAMLLGLEPLPSWDKGVLAFGRR